MLIRLGLALALLTALTVSGQIQQIQPSNPTSLDPIIIDITTPTLGWQDVTVTTSNNVVTITLAGDSFLTALGTVRVPIGRLPAGTYTINVFFMNESTDPPTPEPRPPVTLVVTHAQAIPAMDVRGILVLMLALAAGAILILR